MIKNFWQLICHVVFSTYTVIHAQHGAEYGEQNCKKQLYNSHCETTLAFLTVHPNLTNRFLPAYLQITDLNL